MRNMKNTIEKVVVSCVLLGLALSNAAAVAAPLLGPKVFGVRTYGTVGDGVAMDTEAIQDAIDACNKSGGGTVRVPTGDYHIGTIQGTLLDTLSSSSSEHCPPGGRMSVMPGMSNSRMCSYGLVFRINGSGL